MHDIKACDLQGVYENAPRVLVLQATIPNSVSSSLSEAALIASAQQSTIFDKKSTFKTRTIELIVQGEDSYLDLPGKIVLT